MKLLGSETVLLRQPRVGHVRRHRAEQQTPLSRSVLPVATLVPLTLVLLLCAHIPSLTVIK